MLASPQQQSTAYGKRPSLDETVMSSERNMHVHKLSALTHAVEPLTVEKERACSIMFDFNSQRLGHLFTDFTLIAVWLCSFI